MRLPSGRGRFLRRVVLLFLLGTAVPLAILALLTSWRLHRYLRLQHEAHLSEAAKTYGMSIVERLNGCQRVLSTLAEDVGLGTALSPGRERQLAEWFDRIDVEIAGEAARPLLDPEHSRPTGSTLEEHGPELTAPLDPERPEAGRVTARARTDYLMRGSSSGTVWPTGLELTVLDTEGKVIFTSLSDSRGVEALIAEKEDLAQRQALQWDAPDGRVIGGSWRLPLRLRGAALDWIVVMSGPESASLGARPFVESLMLVVAASFLTVTLLSLRRIRKSLTPLEMLRDKARRMGHQDFGGSLRVTTGDEFEEIASILNRLSGQLERQFTMLGGLNEIAQTSLFAQGRVQRLAETALEVTGRLHPDRAVALALAAAGSFVRHRVLTLSADGTEVVDSELVLPLLHLPEAGRDLEVLHGCDPREIAPLFPGHDPASVEWVALLALRTAASTHGVMAVGGAGEPLSDEESSDLRELANQVALGLTNGRLIRELAELYEGTLTALARAIDANSSWTLGHSGRVTRMALELGRALGLDDEGLETLKRASLLHDVGKLGLPAALLDAPRALTAEERLLVQSHVEKGVRILEPIPGFGPIVPIVAQHHEAFDGRGYPKGLRGPAICLEARILAVADTFDAIRSDRPYREGRPVRDAAEILRAEAGRQFDPAVVEALLAVLRRDGALPADDHAVAE